MLHRRRGRTLWRPRRPILCSIDALGFALTAYLLITYHPEPVVAILPIVILLQYMVSIAYHWFPFSSFLQRLDHFVIALLIGVTFVPYWGTLLPASEMLSRLSLLALLTFGVGTYRVARFPRHAVGGAFYLALAAFPLITSFYELPLWLPPLGLAAFWLGILCYFINFLIHSTHVPNPFPKRFGYREIQHIFVFLGTTVHALVALHYL